MRAGICLALILEVGRYRNDTRAVAIAGYRDARLMKAEMINDEWAMDMDTLNHEWVPRVNQASAAYTSGEAKEKGMIGRPLGSTGTIMTCARTRRVSGILGG